MSEEKLNVVGQSIPRRDGHGHVTGQTIYVDGGANIVGGVLLPGEKGEEA